MNQFKIYTFDSLTYIFDITIVTKISMIPVMRFPLKRRDPFLFLKKKTMLKMVLSRHFFLFYFQREQNKK